MGRYPDPHRAVEAGPEISARLKPMYHHSVRHDFLYYIYCMARCISGAKARQITNGTSGSDLRFLMPKLQERFISPAAC